MALSEYESFANPPLVFPYGGKKYVLKPVNIPDGRQLARIIEGKDKKLSSLPAEEVWKLALGGLWEEFIEDGVPLAFAVRAGLTALAEFQYNRETAERAWETNGDPKALEKYLGQTPPGNRAQRRSTSTAAAKKTR